MVEMTDKNTSKKMLSMVMCGIKYKDDSYVIYCIQRDKEEVNIFVSKAIKGILGEVIDDDFSNGEKEVLDLVVKRILNMEDRKVLEEDGFSILEVPDFDSNLVFDIDKCYVSTVSKELLKKSLIFYNLVSEKIFEQPIVEVVSDDRKFNEGFVSSIILIVLGSVVLIFSSVIIYWVLFR